MTREKHLLPDADFSYILAANKEIGPFSDVEIPSPYEMHNIKCNYWETNDVCNYGSSTLPNHLMLHFNIQSLQAKYDSLVSFLINLSNGSETGLPSIIALTETWLNPSNESLFSIDGYHPLRATSRPDYSNRGGVGFFVRSDLEFRSRPDLNNFLPSTFESLFITIKNINLTLGVIYSTPDSDKSEFLAHFNQAIDRLKQGNESFTLLGDFNINILSYASDTYAQSFVNTIFENGCIPLITKPTRVTQSSFSCIDNIITNKFFSDLVAGPIVEDISDHFPVFYAFPYELSNHKRKTTYEKVFRDLSNDNIIKLNSNLSKTD